MGSMPSMAAPPVDKLNAYRRRIQVPVARFCLVSSLTGRVLAQDGRWRLAHGLPSPRTLPAKIAIQRQTDQLVYDLYRLTNNEIRIVEEATGR